MECWFSISRFRTNTSMKQPQRPGKNGILTKKKCANNNWLHKIKLCLNEQVFIWVVKVLYANRLLSEGQL